MNTPTSERRFGRLRPLGHSPLGLLILLIGSLVIAEGLAFALVGLLPAMPALVRESCDAAILAALSYPVLRFLAIGPLTRELQRRQETERALEEERRLLEQRVQERTSDLEASEQASVALMNEAVRYRDTLARANGQLEVQVSERTKAEAALQLLNTELERRVAERSAELRASEARYTTLFHSTDEGFCIVEILFDQDEKPVDYRFLEINPAFERHTGIREAVGKRMREIAPDHEAHWFETYGRVATTGEAVRFQNHAEQLDRHYDVYACRIGEAADRQVAILFNDISEARQMEIELRDAKDRAETANHAKSEFLSRMSHELRTPMNAVLGYAQLLDLQYQDPKVKEAARSILRGGKHLLALINEVLDLSRIESGNFAISIEPVSVAEILHQAIGLVQPLAKSAEVQISIEHEGDDELHVQADRQRLVQVLINLIGNGIKYNRPGGQVTVRSVIPSGGLARIEISDTGAGISTEDQQSLFQPFQRFGDATVEGTGLGLALSERLVKLMGGTLGLSESAPSGSTFYLELSSATPAYLELALPSPTGGASTWAQQDERGTVLSIEDNLSNMRLLEKVLIDWQGVALIPAMQGLVGLELAREHQPDLILLDVHLPDIMGDKVLERLKADPATQAIPVVVLSADATERQIDRLMAAGAEAYLTKPLDLAMLFAVLRKHLSAKSRSRSGNRSKKRRAA